MIKHLEVKTYEYGSIKVTVKINYGSGNISLVENVGYGIGAFEDKKWVFAGRGVEFMNSWLEILDAMKFAVESAKKELSDYQVQKKKEKEDHVTDILIAATREVEKRSVASKKKK